MKIDLNTPINADTKGANKVRIGDIFENALFRSQIDNAREIYNKIAGKKEVDLTVKELSSIQQAIEPLYIAGIKWQIDDIINQKNGEKNDKEKSSN